MGFLRLDIIWAVIFSVVNVQTPYGRNINAVFPTGNVDAPSLRSASHRFASLRIASHRVAEASTLP